MKKINGMTYSNFSKSDYKNRPAEEVKQELEAQGYKVEIKDANSLGSFSNENFFVNKKIVLYVRDGVVERIQEI